MVVEQTGRTPSGEPAAVIRGLARVRIGVGTTGPGAALWVEGTVLDEPPATPRAQELAREYRGLAATILQKRGAWQVMDVLAQHQMEQGRWVKVEGGYRLTGRSMVPAPVAAGFPWLLVGGIGAGLLVFGLAVFWRRVYVKGRVQAEG